MLCHIDTCSGGYAFSKVPHVDIFKFAEEAVKKLKSACPSAITDGIVRVDIFQTMFGKFVVNEFESLEADYCTTSETDSFFVRNFLVDYWVNVLDKLSL